MKKRMKSIVSILLVAVMVFSTMAMTGCEKKKGNDGTVITWLVPAGKQNDLQLVLDEANKIIEPAIGAKLDMVLIDQSAYNQRMNMNMAAGNDFDICFTSSWLNIYHPAVQRGGLLALDELLEKTPELKKAIPDYAWEAAKVNGSIYAVPNMQIMTASYSFYVLKRLADKYDLDVENASKPEDLEEFLAKVKAGEPDIYPFRNNNTTTPWLLAKYESVSNAGLFDPNDLDKGLIMNPEEELTALKKIHEWYNKGYIREDYLSMGDDTADYTAGKYAVWGNTYMPGGEKEVGALVGEPVVALKPYTTTKIDTRSAISTMLAIGKKSKNPEKALKLIELINTNKELYRLISYGIEGKHYTLDEEGCLEYIEDGGYCFKESWKFGNTFNGYPLKGQDPDVFEQTKAFNDSAEASPLLGFVPDLTPIETELANMSEAGNKYSPITMNPVDYWDDMCKAREEAGNKAVKEELDRQLKEFLASKNK